MSAPNRRSDLRLDWILNQCRLGQTLTRGDVRSLLDLSNENDRSLLFETARALRSRYFGERVFLYGFVYFSTWCRRDCNFCRYRKTNQLAQRYRKNRSEISEIAVRLAESGVHLIDLTMGEDPFFHDDHGIGELVETTRAVKKETHLPVMISPGVVSKETLELLHFAGADWYACYQETHNRRLFARLRPHQDYDERFRSKVEARQRGLLIEEGILTGAGDSSEDIAASLEVMKDLAAEQVRVMTFIPQEGTPLSYIPQPSFDRELAVIAVMRLLFPDRLIPASLDVGGIGGLRARLQAGANVVTSIIPPQAGLVGVSQSALDIDEGYRTVEGIAPILEEMGLRVATGKEYNRWVIDERCRKDVS